MKYCTKCGNELYDEAVICPKCGCVVDQQKYSDVNNNAPIPNNTNNNNTNNQNSGLSKATLLGKVAFAFMIIGTVVASILALIPLAWCLPMTLHYYSCIKEGKQPSIAFKVCSLIFVSLIAGVLMLIDEDNNAKQN